MRLDGQWTHLAGSEYEDRDKCLYGQEGFCAIEHTEHWRAVGRGGDLLTAAMQMMIIEYGIHAP